MCYFKAYKYKHLKLVVTALKYQLENKPYIIFSIETSTF